MQKIKPLKRFGQNYLKDENIINKILAEIDPLPNDNLVEIGPGTGALTSKLLAKTPSFTAIEIDTRVIEQLKKEFPSLNFIQNDFLKLNLNSIYQEKSSKLRVVGNIPYNLTSPIIFKLIENHSIILDSVLMVQNEVAQRITAKRGTKDYGILAVILQFFTVVKYCFKVSPNVFHPKPKVYSAVIHISFKEMEINDELKSFFIKIVKASFGNRRKTLKNSLSNSIFKDVNFFNSGIDLSLRAEQLEINDFLILAKFAYKNLHQQAQT